MDDDVPPGFTANEKAADDVPPGFSAKMGPGAATATAGPPPGIAAPAPAAGNGASSRVSEGLAAHLKQSAKVATCFHKYLSWHCWPAHVVLLEQQAVLIVQTPFSPLH